MKTHTATIAALLLATTAAAQDGPLVQEENTSVTEQSITVNGRQMRYRAEAGYMPQLDGEGETLSNMFFMAYTLGGVDDVSTRPLTFVFNGGPGSSSVWLHLGTAGPRRVLMSSEGEALSPPSRLVDNEHTWLTFSDLVFIDPVGTGYSRPAEGQNGDQFWGLEEDLRSVGDFIRNYVTTRERWSSPKFLAGESYGTTRAAGLSDYLQNRHRMDLNGVVLISAILNFQTARFAEGNDLPYMLFLPTYTAIAWHHKMLPDDLQSDLQATLRQVEEFALNEYNVALARGADLSPSDRASVVRKLSRFTGLTPEYIEQTNLRINISRFTKELLRSDRRTVGRLDGRFKGLNADAAGETSDFDPSMAAISEPYTTAFNDYVRRELGYKNNLPYYILGGGTGRWSYAGSQNSFVNVAERLRDTMNENPYLKVHVAAGYYDLATPYFAAEYTMDHMHLEPELQGNITFSHYEAGHMMYIHIPSLAKFTDELRAFYKDATSQVIPQE